MKWSPQLACLAALVTSISAVAQSDATDSRPREGEMLVKITVTSQRYGSFVQEKTVGLNETASFSSFSAHHAGMLYEGRCPVNSTPPDIDDGVLVKVTPMQISSNGAVGAQLDVRASRFLKYRKFDQGMCGEMSFAQSEGLPMKSYRQFFPAGHEELVVESVSFSDTDGTKDLVVKAEFFPKEVPQPVSDQ